MSSNTKDKILEVSLEEFNKHSILKTSLRGLAAKLNMSDGNLRYHFRTIKDLVLALIRRYKVEHNRLNEQESQLDIKSSFRLLFTLFHLIHSYRFIYLEKKYILHYYPDTTPLFNEISSYTDHLFESIIKSLTAQKALEKNIDSIQLERLKEQFKLIVENWINNATQNEEDIEKYARICFSLFVPYIEKNLKLVI